MWNIRMLFKETWQSKMWQIHFHDAKEGITAAMLNGYYG